MISERPGHELSVDDLSRLVACAVDGLPRRVTVRGRLGDLGTGYKKHVFASLRGSDVAIRCFIHARIAERIPARLAEGDTVVIRGRVSWYRARGDIQLVADSVSMVDDSTRAREAVARLQAALEREGTLRMNRGLRMPRMPRRVAVVGGHSSAAVLDIVTAIHRRAPWIGVDVHTTRLQGDGAHLEIAAAIAAAAGSGADVIAVVRGGGATGDFMPFDTAEVCRAIAGSRVPVVTALGHEQDRRLADAAAHTAASTPSDAARHIVPDASQVRTTVASARHRMGRALAQSLADAQSTRTAAVMRLSSSAQRITASICARVARVGLDQRLMRVVLAVRGRHVGLHRAVSRSAENVERRVQAIRDTSVRTQTRNADAVRSRTGAMRAALHALQHRIQVSHPNAVIARGFVIARDPDGAVVTRAEDAAAAGVLHLEFSSGTIIVHTSTPPSP